MTFYTKIEGVLINEGYLIHIFLRYPHLTVCSCGEGGLMRGSLRWYGTLPPEFDAAIQGVSSSGKVIECSTTISEDVPRSWLAPCFPTSVEETQTAPDIISSARRTKPARTSSLHRMLLLSAQRLKFMRSRLMFGLN